MVGYKDKNDLRYIPPIPIELSTKVLGILEEGMNIPGSRLIDKIQCAYSAIDVFNEFVSTFTVCGKGCSACCNYDVQVSRLEAEYIAVNCELNIDTGDVSSVNVRKPCTFLGKDGICAVYEFRPLNCRTFHTIDDPKYCATPLVRHQIYGSASSNYGNDIYKQIADWIREVNRSMNLPYRDIRDWFVDAS